MIQMLSGVTFAISALSWHWGEACSGVRFSKKLAKNVFHSDNYTRRHFLLKISELKSVPYFVIPLITLHKVPARTLHLANAASKCTFARDMWVCKRALPYSDIFIHYCYSLRNIGWAMQNTTQLDITHFKIRVGTCNKCLLSSENDV